MASSRTLNTAKNLSVGSGTQIFSLILSFVSRTVFVVTLGNEYLSVNGLFANVLTLLSFTELGIGSAIIYSLYKPLALDDKEQVGKLINLFATAYRYIIVVILLLGFCVIPFLSLIISDVPDVKENISLLYVLFLLNTVGSYVYGYKKSLLIADQKNYVVITIHTILNTILVGMQIAILYLTHNFILYLLSFIGITLLNNILTTVYVNKKYSWISEYECLKLKAEEWTPIFTNIKNIIIYKLGSVILNGSSNIIVSGMIKTTLVGICSNYFMVINAVTTIINQGVAGICASIGNYNVTASKEDNENVFKQLCLLSFWAIGMVSIGMSCLLTPFVKLWLGTEYLLDSIVVVILVLGFYTLMINSVPSSYRTAMGLFKEARLAPLFAAIINIIAGILAAKLWGLSGVFAATVLARLFTYCIIDPYYVYKKGFEMSPKSYYLRFCIWLAILVVSYIGSYIVIKALGVSGIVGLLMDTIVCLLFFNVVFFIIYGRDKDLRIAVNRIKKNLLHR
ncbi:lipopolysaccharide biosynthesis protein [Bacteroides congonensis]